MEPHATTAVWDGGRLTIYDATQWVRGQQRNLATVLGLDEADVRVLCPFVGGGFGWTRSEWVHPPQAAAAAQGLDGPVEDALNPRQHETRVRQCPEGRATVTHRRRRAG